MKRIFLIGYMGAGKTTVGKALAKSMDLSFIDLDVYIENRFRKQISSIFAEKGEDGFRKIEQNMLHEVSDFEDCVISTGGGTPCFFDNMEYMKQHGTTVYLQVSVDELASRLEVCKQPRPILKDKSGEELRRFIAGSLEKRKDYYLRAALVYDAEQMVSCEDVNTIVSNLQKLL